MRQLRHVTRMAYGEALASDVRIEGDVPVMGSGGVTGRHDAANTLAPVTVIGRKGSFGSIYWSNVPAFVIDTAYFIDRRFTANNLRWLYYALQALNLREVSQDVGVPGLSREAAYGLRLPEVPSMEEQRRIADFLDDQVTRLDRAIGLRQRQIELLRERHADEWASLITSPLKESKWQPLRRFLVSICDGPFGSSLTSGHYTDEGARVIRLGNIGEAAFRNGDEAFIHSTYYRTLLQHAVVAGDLIIAGLGDENHALGRACVAPAGLGQALVKADCFRVRLDESRVRHNYAAVALSSPPVVTRTSLLSRGATRARINTQVARDIRIPVPDVSRQERIVTDFASSSAHLRAGVALAERHVTLIRERRQALITAAVTGEFDVTAARWVA